MLIPDPHAMEQVDKAIVPTTKPTTVYDHIVITERNPSWPNKYVRSALRKFRDDVHLYTSINATKGPNKGNS